MTTIDAVDAWEILDSRGEPTVRVRVEAGGETGVFSVPAGASTGSHAAVEVRDGGERYGGRGVRTAVAAVTDSLAPAVIGRDVTDQGRIDTVLRETDGSASLSRLGGNAVLGVSGAVAHAASAVRGVPLYEHLAPSTPGRLPRPWINMISGGAHGAGPLAIQDVMAVPIGADSLGAALETAWGVREALGDVLRDRGHRPLVADEGGFAPAVDQVRPVFAMLDDAVNRAGFTPGIDVAYAIDVAATQLRTGAAYRIQPDEASVSPAAMSDYLAGLVADHPIVGVEDPLAEDDWDAWQALRTRIGDEVAVIGDDLLVTQPERLDRAIATGAATAILIKPNQAGTISRTIAVAEQAREAGFGRIVSARSGETADTTIADLAIACGSRAIKIGSLARSERLAKYNRLIEIDRFGDRPFRDPAGGGPG